MGCAGRISDELSLSEERIQMSVTRSLTRMTSSPSG